MKLLALDFETTWENPVDVKVLRITEIGAVLMDWGTKSPLLMMSEFVHSPEYPKSPTELVELTGITDEMLVKYGKNPRTSLKDLNVLMREADYVVAHNGSLFDRPLYKNECYRHVVDIVDTPWIDTRTDIIYPSNIKARKLTHLAAEHGFVNPFAHRALFDCLTMMKVLSLYPIEEVIALAKEPLINCVARVSYQDRDLAKSRGYYWNGEDKSWFKPMKESQFEEEEANAPFVCAKAYIPGEIN